MVCTANAYLLSQCAPQVTLTSRSGGSRGCQCTPALTVCTSGHAHQQVGRQHQIPHHCPQDLLRGDHCTHVGCNVVPLQIPQHGQAAQSWHGLLVSQVHRKVVAEVDAQGVSVLCAQVGHLQLGPPGHKSTRAPGRPSAANGMQQSSLTRVQQAEQQICFAQTLHQHKSAQGLARSTDAPLRCHVQ